MAQLKVNLLGAPHVEIDGQAVAVKRRKVLGLLAYLALSRQLRRRDHLAALFWPGYDQRAARANLRRALSDLKRALDENRLLVDGEHVRFRHGADLEVDVSHFRRLVDLTRTHPHASIQTCPDCLAALKQALDFYKGDFMAGFSISDSPEFEDWQLLETENLRRELNLVLKNLVGIETARGDIEQAETHVLRWLAENPLDEDAHRTAMSIYAAHGKRAAAITQFERCQEILRDELAVEPAPETVALIEDIRAGVIRPAMITPGGGTTPRVQAEVNLPARPYAFIGREAERAEISRLLEDEPTCRMLVLVGPGGIGKTELAIQAASENRNLFPDGVYLVPLQSVQDSRNITEAIARALNIPLADGDLALAQLLKILGKRQCLLLLDNYEHLVDDAGITLLEQLLIGAPRLTLLLTSRLRLNLQSEWSIELNGLALPSSRDLELTRIESSDAVALFVTRARRVSSGFNLAEETVEDVAHICRLLDGSPLGIVLAASWLRMLSCREIAEELASGIDFLTASLHDLPERHRNVRSVFEHSWRLLSPVERSALARLSIFRGGFTRRAAARVADATLPLLASLVDNSLIQPDDGGRYRTHALLQQYAAEKLSAEVQEGIEIGDRHADFYATYVYQRVDHLKGSQYPMAMRDIGAEIDNIRAAWRWSVERRLVNCIDRFTEGLLLFYECRGWFVEGYEAFELAAVAFGLDEQHSGELQVSGPELALVVAQLEVAHGILAARKGPIERGRRELEQAIERLEELRPDSRSWEAMASHWLAHARLFRGHHRHALAMSRQAVDIYRILDDRWGIGITLAVMAGILFHLAEYREQEQVAQEAVDLLREIGEQRWLGFAINHRGYAARIQGKYQAAMQDISESLRRFELLQDQLGCGYSLREMGYVSIALGKYGEARVQMEHAYNWFDEAGARYALMFPLEGLAQVGILTGSFVEAEDQLRQALALSEEVGELRGIAQCHDTLGWLAYIRGDYLEARSLQEQALKHFQELTYRWGTASVHNRLAATILKLPSPDTRAAAKHLVAAYAIADEIGALPLTMQILTGAAEWATVGDVQDTDLSVDLASVVLQNPATEAETYRVARALHYRLSDNGAETPTVARDSTHDKATIEELWSRFITLAQDLREKEE